MLQYLHSATSKLLFRLRSPRHVLPTPPPRPFERVTSRRDWYREIAISEASTERIVTALQKADVTVQNYSIDVAAFQNWCQQYGAIVPSQDQKTLPPDIADIQTTLRTEKLLEYYLSLVLGNLKSGAVVADFGSADSQFLYHVVKTYKAIGFAVDPSLAGRMPPPGGGITFLPQVISQAADQLPLLDLITLHCSFEMFNVPEMTAVLSTAAKKLKPGGRLIILPLYLAERRTVYADTQVPGAFPHQEAQRVGVEDYWQIGWSEWHSADTLAARLINPFPELRFTLSRVCNASVPDPGCYLRFIGTWERML